MWRLVLTTKSLCHSCTNEIDPQPRVIELVSKVSGGHWQAIFVSSCMEPVQPAPPQPWYEGAELKGPKLGLDIAGLWRWQCLTVGPIPDAETGATWVDYIPEVNRAICNAWDQHQPRVHYTCGGQRYTIALDEHYQVNEHTGTKREIRRVFVSYPALPEPDYPPYSMQQNRPRRHQEQRGRSVPAMRR